MKTPLLAAAAAAAGAATTPLPVEAPPQIAAPPAALPAARLPGFAAELSARATISGPDAWTIISDDRAWAAIARADVETRQSARWALARSLIGRGLSAEAYGVLQVMNQDDPDLALIDSFRLARGAALAAMGRSGEALDALVGPGLAANSEACAWRLVALAQMKLPVDATQQFGCARAAIMARTPDRRKTFLLAAAGAALQTGKPHLTIDWLRSFGRGDAAADLLRARAYLGQGHGQHARLALTRAQKSGNEAQRLDAELTGIEAALQAGALTPRDALRKVEHIRYVWRGDALEERALRLSYRISSELGDLRGALSAGSTLFRYFELGGEAGPLLAGLQAQLASALEPKQGMKLDQALGLYWDFRDLTPLGAEGDLLVRRLGDRLQEAGLYARAADLFEHQLFARTRDLAQGPLSAKVARLHILAGHPERAIDAIRRTNSVAYPADMRWERDRVEAIALSHLGKPDEALAVLEQVPDAGGLRTEILWRKRDWNGLASAVAPGLPAADGLSEVGQAVVLRYAVALAMLRREAELAQLNARYAGAFAALPTASTFEALTGDPSSIDPDALARAMASIPSATPAGDIADLFGASPASGG